MAFSNTPTPTSPSTKKYTTLPKIITQDLHRAKDAEDPYSSSTEVDEDEEPWGFNQEQHHKDPDASAPLNPKSKSSATRQRMSARHPRHRSKTSLYVARFRRFRWLIDVTLLVINISLSVLLLKGFWQEMDGQGKVQVGGDYARNAPTFPTKVVKFEADETFVPKNTSEFFEQKTIDRWNTMMPAGTGWGDKTPETTFFTTSMTHQLHCVFMMARIYSAISGDMKEKLPGDYHSHYLHCVDYLRQGIMCSGDLAMEPHEQTDPDDNGPNDGSWNGHHVCKDYNHIIPYLEEQIYEGVRMVLPIDD